MADELMVVSNHVPAQIYELASFIKVGREKLTAVRAEIRAMITPNPGLAHKSSINALKPVLP